MKTKITLLILIIIIPIALSIFYTNNNIKTQEAIKIEREDTIKIKNNKYEINIIYPITDYPLLNREIINILDNYRKQFYNALKYTPENIYYTLSLYINYKGYTYQNYLSFIFYIEIFTGGAHPNHLIITTNFDKSTNKIITIDTLIQGNHNIPNILSHLSRKSLSKIKIFNDPNIHAMMLDGTTPTRNNFKNIVFTPNGLLILFERYQIAPYAYGQYSVIIPYYELK